MTQLHHTIDILFVQLPLVDHDYSYIAGNFEYASTSLQGYIERNFHKKTALLARSFSFFSTDEDITDEIMRINPGITSFSTTMWNGERHLRIAEMVRQEGYAGTILFGGPEVEDYSFLFHKPRPYVDLFFSGEGEWFFEKYFSDTLPRGAYDSCGNLRVIQPPSEPVNMADVVEPLTEGYLEPMPDGSGALELTRGCPFHCSYCYYSSHTNTVRSHSLEVMEKLFEMFPRVKDVYLMVPALDRLSFLDELLDLMIEKNPGMTFHSEMRTDRVDRVLAERLFEAGFVTLEVGLQTLAREPLKAIHRGGNHEREVEGMKILQDAGITLSVGLIPGLPGDKRESFIDGMEYLCKEGFCEELEIYPLSLLPGTRLRQEAEEMLVTEGMFQRLPPYYYMSGWGMDTVDLREVLQQSEELTGFRSEPLVTPWIDDDHRGLSAGALIYGRGLWHPRGRYRWQTTVVTLAFINGTDNFMEQTRILTEELPSDFLYNIFYFSDLPLEYHQEELERMLKESSREGFHSRLHAGGTVYDSHHVRLYHVTRDYDYFTSTEELIYRAPRPVLLLNDENHNEVDFSQAPSRILVDRGYSFLHDLPTLLEGEMSQTAFMDKKDMVECYAHGGIPLTEFPVEMKLLHIESSDE